MSEIHSAKKDYSSAAKLLEKINIESGNRQVAPDDKVDICVTIAEYWFEDDEAVNAEKFINKAAHFVHLCQK